VFELVYYIHAYFLCLFAKTKVFVDKILNGVSNNKTTTKNDHTVDYLFIILIAAGGII
jgi:hypothetical protein